VSTVETRNGKLAGTVEDGVTVFRGIPYAAPPVGELRWLPPQPAANWAGVRQAVAFGASPMQNGSPLDKLLGGDVGPTSEDCLYLNVWTPAADGNKRPVMVWIHGGAYMIGSGSQAVYGGGRLAGRGDVVVVNINYRLGPLGFMNLNEATGGAIPATGNEGLLDQVAALAWVRDNIAAFGGDPGNVTIFGESAGGMSVGALLGLPQARGLFHKAIPQSGASHTAAAKADALRVTEAIFAATGLSPDRPGEMRNAEAKIFTHAMAALATGQVPGVRASILGGIPFRPVVDGDVLKGLPIEQVRRGSSKNIALLTGTTTEEWKFFEKMDPNLANLDQSGMIKRLTAVLPDVELDPLISAHHGTLTARGEQPTPLALLSAVQTDRIFTEPAYRLLQAHTSNGGQAYSYLFDWKSPMGSFGACHAMDIGFVLGTCALPDAQRFFGSGPGADALAAAMMDAWVSFARTASPGISGWPAYEPEHRKTWVFAAENKLVTNPSPEVRKAWANVPDALIGRA